MLAGLTCRCLASALGRPFRPFAFAWRAVPLLKCDELNRPYADQAVLLVEIYAVIEKDGDYCRLPVPKVVVRTRALIWVRTTRGGGEFLSRALIGTGGNHQEGLINCDPCPFCFGGTWLRCR